MGRIGFGLLAVAAIVLGLLVGTFNSEKVSLDLIWIQLEWPLGLLLLCALVIGLIVGMLVIYIGQVVPLRIRLSRSSKQLPPGGAPDLHDDP